MMKGSTFLSLLACLGIASWIVTDYFGGMFFYLFSYPFLILLAILLYVFSIILLVIKLVRGGIKNNKPNLLVHVSLLVFILLLKLYDSDVFRSKRILSATLYDKFIHYTLILRKNGTCEMKGDGDFGLYKVAYGNYILKGDTIKFTKIPFDDESFIDSSALIDRTQNVIFIYKDSAGIFDNRKTFTNHFKIDKQLKS